MKIKMDQKILTTEGDVIKNPNNGQEMTLRSISIDALLFPVEKDTPKEKNDKYDLYKKVNVASKIIDFTIEEVAKLKKLIGELKPQLVMGQAWEMLENAEK